jgi:DNA-binding GntR family transcriptional regulator
MLTPMLTPRSKRVKSAPQRARAASRGARARTPMTVDAIYDRVLGAIMAHQVPPGTKLVEERLASAFGVSRTKIRQALGRLAHDGIVTMYPNRGAFVASPSVEDAHHVFEARRLIEPALIRRLAEAAAPAQVRKLREHVVLEDRARSADDRRAIVQLTGEFHLLIAQMAGNPVLLRAMREIESMTALVIFLYEAPRALSCPHGEHDALVDAIEAGDGARAAKLMLAHLDHVEAGLDLSTPMPDEVDLEAVFA